MLLKRLINPLLSLFILFISNEIIMKITYDSSVDAAYIEFKSAKEVTTIRLTEDVAIDLGANEKVIGIEILNASKHLSLDKKEPYIVLEKLKAKVA